MGLPKYSDTTIYEKQQVFNLDEVCDGFEFESYIANLLRYNEFSNVEVTKKSGDFGIDVLAEKDRIKYAVQCKLYSQPVGNKAIQEVAAGKDFYNCHIAIVATNNTFTSAAKELAEKIGVVLWDGEKISDMEKMMNGSRLLYPINFQESGYEHVDDTLYEQAVVTVENAGWASAYLLRRMFKISQRQAEYLLVKLEAEKIISPANDSMFHALLV